MIYEYALNDQIQSCLILEQLFEMGDFYLKAKSALDNFQMLKIILEILKITSNKELKIKLLQDLNLYSKNIEKMASFKAIDKRKLYNLLKQITYYIDSSKEEESTFGAESHKNPFLLAMQSNFFSGCFDLSNPLFQVWLQQNESIRTPQLLQWFGSFNKLREIVNLILKLLRDSASWEKVKTEVECYRIDKNPCLIRIKIEDSKNIYPHIIVHSLTSTISFHHLEVNRFPTKINYNFEFNLALCKL